MGYLAGFWLAPERTRLALTAAGGIASHLAFPLCLVFLALTLTNRFLRPDVVGRLLGRDSGIRGLALAAVGGVLSHGPIFAWYPLLRDLRNRGAGSAAMAVFLCNRAGVKPFLLPVMVGHFGWPFVLCLTGMGFCGSILAGIAVAAIAGEPKLADGDPSGRPGRGAAQKPRQTSGLNSAPKSETMPKAGPTDRMDGK
jgi:uncharacterized membrane protein YraQ (UPF0718 family)